MSYFLLDEFRDSTPYEPGEQLDGDYLKLNANESSFPPSPKVQEVFSNTEINGLSHYSDPSNMKLREAIGKKYGFGGDQVFVGNGADEVLSFCMMSFFRPGMKVCFPDVTYDFYRVYANTYGLDYKQIPLKSDFTINVDDYVNTDRDVIIANPNNPTGQAIPVSEIEKIVAANPKRMVIIDEAYVDYGNESCIPLVKKYGNLVVVQTFSKSRNMPGARIGFAISSKDIIADMDKIKFSFNPFNMSKLAIDGGVAAIEDDAYFSRCVGLVKNEREKFEDALEKMGFGVMRTTTNFVFFKTKDITAAVLADELKKSHILVRIYQDMPRIRDYVRITVGTHEEMTRVIKEIRRIENDPSVIRKAS